MQMQAAPSKLAPTLIFMTDGIQEDHGGDTQMSAIRAQFSARGLQVHVVGLCIGAAGTQLRVHVLSTPMSCMLSRWALRWGGNAGGGGGGGVHSGLGPLLN
jgi:hypothetical protein